MSALRCTSPSNLYTDKVVRVLEQHVRDTFVDWLIDFEIEPTEDLQAHFWQWAQDNDTPGGTCSSAWSSGS